MQLDFDRICDITVGAEEITQETDGFHFNRFSTAQRGLYKQSSPEDFYRKTFATSGVRLQFSTDSRKLKLDVSATSASSRSYFALDVFANGVMIGSIDNLTDDMPLDYTLAQLPLGVYSKTFDLGEGMKDVCIFLPWSVCVVINGMELDDDAVVIPIKPKYKLLTFGDSITQGYDAQHPSNKYITRLALALDAAECNKAIGGEEFYPPMAEAENGIAPDYIVVAYGTNDWSHCVSREVLEEHCSAFYRTLGAKYPNAKLFALTPIWRLDWEQEKPTGYFHDVEEIVREAVKDIPNATVIRGFDHVPKDTDFFADLRLHPNDAGFDHYYQNLWSEITKEK